MHFGETHVWLNTGSIVELRVSDRKNSESDETGAILGEDMSRILEHHLKFPTDSTQT